jgi:histidinol-phosphate phosphatase family protein
MQVVILAGGLGTRLRTVTGDTPKALAAINGRPILGYQLEQIAHAGLRNVLMLTGYGGDQISDYCSDGSKWGLRIRCIQETASAGTAGAVLQAIAYLESRFMVLYGDTIFEIDMARMETFHRSHSADVTLLVHPNDHPHDSDLIEVDRDDRVRAFHPCPHAAQAILPNLVNAAMYIVERAALAALDGLPPRPDFARHVFPLLLERGAILIGYRSPEYIKDAGTPARFEKVALDLLSGRVSQRCLRNPSPAIFLDRDGTLIEARGHLRRPEDVTLLPGVANALARLNQSKYRTVLVTNQPVVARGECDEATLHRIHNRLESLLGARGAYLDALYVCPHHPDAGFPGERIDLKISCLCRKPGIALLEQAQQDLNLDLSASWFIGDSTADIMVAQRGGMMSILVETGEAGRDGKWPCHPNYTCLSIVEAIELILNRGGRNDDLPSGTNVEDLCAAMIAGAL